MTNELVKLNNSSLTMTSCEIAELTGKQHKHVLRDIRDMLTNLYNLKDGPNLDHDNIQGVTEHRDTRGYTAQYLLDKNHTLTLLTGYDVKARFKVVKRWQELELAQQDLSQNYSTSDLRTLSIAARAASEANRILADTALALANQYERNSQTEAPISPAEPQPKSQPALLPPREAAFIQAWWSCLGTQTVTASNLYRAIATQQCQELNATSGALLGDISQWTAKKLSHALKRWSQLVLDNFTVLSLGKTSRGILWRLERKN